MRRILIAAGACALALAPAGLRAQEAQPDPARLEAARTTVNAVFPDGTYARIMNKTMESVIGNMMGSAGQLPLQEMAAMSGVTDEQLAQLDGATLKQVMAIYDPHYQERLQATSRIMMTEMGSMMTKYEPAMREGLASAYARRFTAKQLGELNRFFATPTGQAYAADSMMIFMDPEVTEKMSDFVPDMTQQMPAIMAKVQQATAEMPQPRTLDELSAEERQRLAGLLGVPEAELGQQSSTIDLMEIN